MNKKNFHRILLFDLFYKLITVAVFLPIIQVIIKISMKIGGVSYLTNEYIYKYLSKPTTILAIAIVLLLFFMVLAVEQQFIFAGFERINREDSNVGYIITNGFDRFRWGLRWNNFLSIILNAMIIAIMNIAVIYNIIINIVNVNTYFTYAMRRNPMIRVYILMFICLCLVVAVFGLFTSVIMYDKKITFVAAFKESCQITKKHFLSMFAGVIGYNLVMAAIIIMLYAVISAVVIAGVNILDMEKARAAIYLFVIRYSSVILNIVLSLVSIPATYVYILNRYKKYAGRFVGRRKDNSNNYSVLIKLVVVISCAVDLYLVVTMVSHNPFEHIQFLKFTEITAHRGSSVVYPENTMPAFEAALDELTDKIELDVRQTADGGFVVMHDENLKRTTGVDAKVGHMTMEEVCALDAGSYMSEEFAGVNVPSLEEVLEFASGRVSLNIELKTASTDKDYAQGIYELLEEYDFVNKCVVTSTDYNVLKQLKMIDEDITTGYILSMAVGNYYNMKYVDFFSVNYKFVTSTMIYVLHDRGKEIHIWTLNDKGNIEKFAGMGADNIITDDPLMAREVVNTMESPDIFKAVLDYVFSN